MRKFIAALLLVCFGMILPLAASPMRVCLLAEPTPNCCTDCDGDHQLPDPCCVDVEEMPDSSAPHPPLELPPVVFVELPQIVAPPFELRECSCEMFAAPESIRGPTSPAAHRAVLGIWRL